MASRERIWQFRTAHRWFLTVLLSTTIASGLSAQKTSFPGEKSETKSPDGRFIIRNTDDEKQEPSHVLALIDTKDGSTRKVYSYERHVDVLWSSSSTAFILNDYEGSDAAHPVLFTTPWTNQPVDLREKLIGFLRSGRGVKSVLDNQHVYFSAQRWLSGDEILCQVSGYGDMDPKGFTSRYVYKIGSGFRPYR